MGVTNKMSDIKLKHSFLENIKLVISNAQVNSVKAIDFYRVLMYWNIGRIILEEEQNGFGFNIIITYIKKEAICLIFINIIFY